MLDDMDLERERGITIKASAVTMFHEKDGTEYQLNMIDTPGHVDFNYEVSRALKACEGAIVLVDANQGIEAQTIANMKLAREQGLTIVPAVTKIDLPNSRPIEAMAQMEETFDMDPDDILAISGKTGENVEELLDAVIERVPPPQGDEDGPLRALVFDSYYNQYRGVVVFVRIFDGHMEKGDRIRMMGEGQRHEIGEVGIFHPEMTPRERLQTGEVGYLMAGIKNIREVKIGDTVTQQDDPASTALTGYKEPKPMVFCGLYPEDNDRFDLLKDALDKLYLNTSSFVYQEEASEALGFGFRCGFLGPLHMEVIQQRLERENEIGIVQTAPNVTYRVEKTDGEMLEIDRPSRLPDRGQVERIFEPWVKVDIILPTDYVGNVMKLIEQRRGEYQTTRFFSDQRAMLIVDLPLSEMAYGFFDKLKSVTRGLGTMDYEMIGERESDLVKLDILVNEKPVDALSIICHDDESYHRGKRIVETLKEKIDRHLFPVPLQAAVGGDIIARETIPPKKKDVTAKCYGGDVTRKRKLREQQKEGKKRMKAVGNVDIPQEAFLSVLEADEE
jgi:GTP-binding protein LepA